MRVSLTYRPEFGGPVQEQELPFVVGVLADLSGNTEESTPALMDRRFVDLDVDNFDSILAQIAPRVGFAGEDTASSGRLHETDLRFHSLQDFSPDSVARQVPALAELLERRVTLNQLREALAKYAPAADRLYDAWPTPYQTAATPDDVKLRDLLRGVPLDEGQLFKAVAAFAFELRNAVQPLSSTGPEDFLNERMRLLDGQLSRQVNAILHSAPFQKLEASWRGLHYLVSRAASGRHVKIRVLNVTRRMLSRDLLRATSLDQSIFFKRVHDDIYGSCSGEPFGVFLLDFAFGPQKEDIHLLSMLAEIGQAVHAPCIAAASPEVFGIDKFSAFDRGLDFSRPFEQDQNASWKTFQEREASRYAALTLPRILMRVPYGGTGPAVESFAFSEDTSGASLTQFLWGNAAYAFVSRLEAAFSQFGWCAAISGMSGAGEVEALPVYFDDRSGAHTMGPCETTFNEKQDFALAELGFLPLTSGAAGGRAVFFTAYSCHARRSGGGAAPLEDAGAVATTRLFTRLDYLLCASRLVHYLCCIYRDCQRAAKTRAEWEAYFNNWISQYIQEDGTDGLGAKARRPLKAARIEVTELPDLPHAREVRFYFHPRFQLQDAAVAYRLVAQLPMILTDARQ